MGKLNPPEISEVFGIIGDPIGHTLSPDIHRMFGMWTGKHLSYEAYHVKAENLEAAIEGAHALGIMGMNVTVPHKSAVIPLLSDIDPLAEKIGAVNTLVRIEGGYKGYNTDVSGLKSAIAGAGQTLENARVIVLGAGGAGRAATFLASSEKARDVVVLNRTIDKAKALCEEVNSKLGRDVAHAEDTLKFTDTLKDKKGEKYIAIQCTSVGLTPHSDDSIIEDPAFFAGLSFAVDIVYRPYETKFLRLAHDAGVPSLGGLAMLLHQAADAFLLWYPDSDLNGYHVKSAHRLLRSRLQGFCDIALTGFMGSGKTTVARVLADRLNYETWDTDRMIEEGCNMSVSDIFNTQGEEAFRHLETTALKKITAVMSGLWDLDGDGLIISTGGGIVKRQANRRILSDNIGSVVYLRAKPETVLRRLKGDRTRPLLAGDDKEAKLRRVEEMMKEREPLYEECARIVIDTDDKTPEEIATEIIRKLS